MHSSRCWRRNRRSRRLPIRTHASCPSRVHRRRVIFATPKYAAASSSVISPWSAMPPSVSHLITHAKTKGQQWVAKLLLAALAGTLHRARLVCGLGGFIEITTDAALRTRNEPRWVAGRNKSDDACPNVRCTNSVQSSRSSGHRTRPSPHRMSRETPSCGLQFERVGEASERGLRRFAVPARGGC